jgi:hypothetical protein
MSDDWQLGFDTSKLRHVEWGGAAGGGGVQMELWGMADVQAMLNAYTDRELQNRTRRALRAGAKVFREAMRAQGKGDWSNRPRSFNKTRTRGHRNPLGVSVSPQSPLSNIFEHGAKGHDIGKAGQLLYGVNPPFIARGPVHHPGVSARPFIGPVFAAHEKAAEAAFAKVLLAETFK